MINVQYLWATPLFTGAISEPVRIAARDSVVNLHSESLIDPDPARIDPSGNWTSRDDLHTLPQFDALCKELLEFSSECLDTLTVKRDSLYISAMWSNLAPVGVAHQAHSHPNCMYSGVVYLQTPPGAAGTFFTDPRPGSYGLRPAYTAPSMGVIGQDCRVAPAEGKMLFWPAWLDHGVMNTQYQPHLTRVSLSWNVMLRAELGSHTTRLDTRSL